MKLVYSLLVFTTTAYLLAVAALYFFQRQLLFHPVPLIDIPRQQISIHNDNLALKGWVLNPGQQKALLYFGGNSEQITNKFAQFEITFKDYSVYLIHYRGYGGSQGKPSEAGLFSDARAVYDELKPQHESISLLGRSLGSGVAVYLASTRDVERLILLTPYDSIAEVAQTHYPYFPARYLVHDRFDSIRYAPLVRAPVLIVAAEFDRVVPLQHTLRLRDALKSDVQYRLIARAAHNDLTEFAEYQSALQEFIAQ